jgi:hypothetical protein
MVSRRIEPGEIVDPGRNCQRHNDPLCSSGIVQRKCFWEKLDQGQRCTGNFEKMDVQEEVSAETMQKWDKKPSPEIAATKQEGIHQDLHENHWTGDCEANCQIVCWVADSQELNVVKGSAPSEMEEESTHAFGIRGTRNMGALATRDNFAPLLEKKNSGGW